MCFSDSQSVAETFIFCSFFQPRWGLRFLLAGRQEICGIVFR